MNQQNENSQHGTEGNTENNSGKNEEQTIAQNPNPRANANIKNAPFEKTAENDSKADDVGTEITDGEAG